MKVTLQEKMEKPMLRKTYIAILLSLSSYVQAKDYTVFWEFTIGDLRELSKISGLNHTKLDKALTFILKCERAFVPTVEKEYYSVLTELIKKHNLKKGCEIGVFFGSHLETMLAQTTVEKLYGIDAYVGKYIDYGLKPRINNRGIKKPGQWHQSCADILYFLVNKRLNRWGSRLHLIRSLSTEAAHNFQDGELDFVFIDASHDYESIKQDLASWYDKVRDGGIVSGNDYNRKAFPGVVQAVNEFFKEKKLQINRGGKARRIWWVEKLEVQSEVH